MKLKLNINYVAQQGECLYVNVLAADGKTKQHKMKLVGTETWQASLDVDADVEYFYSVQNGKEEVRREWWMTPHHLKINEAVKSYTCYDCWLDMPDDSYLYSSAFTDCIHFAPVKNKTTKMPAKALILKVQAPQLYKDEYMTIVGDEKCIGAWDISKRVKLSQNGNNEWYIVLDADKLTNDTIEFKFVAANQDPTIDSQWEEGANRTLRISDIAPSLLGRAGGESSAVVLELSRAWFAGHQERLAGTAVPVFSLRSKGSFGVGDFGDLKMMIDWAAKTHQRVLQVLPINDTTQTHTWTDCYPYSAISIFALHPMYADLRQLPALKDAEKAKEFEELRKKLNALPQIDYEAVNNAKNEYLYLIYEQEGKKTLASKDFKVWFKEESHWIKAYAEFCVNRDKDIPSTLNPKPSTFYYYVQYILATQMKAAHKHARENNVVLKGDIPIGVNRYGCDVWQEPRYFNMNGQAGAPPDSFSADGQNWGFPTYNWDEMMKDNLQWWIRRFSNMSKYFDAYRIDHVLGFFRIWEIPIECETGLLGQFQPALGLTKDEIHDLPEELFLADHRKPGYYHPFIAAHRSEIYSTLSDEQKNHFNWLYDDYFYRRNTHFWYQEAMKKLPKIVNATKMLVCAEDLGMIPECVPWVMNELRILSLEIQSMPKDDKVTFGVLERNPYRSVCTISSHDTATLRMWWDEDYDRAQQYYNIVLHHGGEVPHPMPEWLAQEIITQHLACPSMLCILTLQDWLSMSERLRLPDANAERINIPANPKHYWRYRMHLNIEDLIADEEFTALLHNLIDDTHR